MTIIGDIRVSNIGDIRVSNEMIAWTNSQRRSSADAGGAGFHPTPRQYGSAWGRDQLWNFR
jgi:hypothetical protein